MASKASKGSIVQLEKSKQKGKCRKWRLVVSLGRDPITGKYPQKARVVHCTYSEAKAALAKFMDELEKGEVVRRSTYTFDDYADHFIETRKASGEVAPGTIDRERDKLKSIGFLIGKMKLQEITPDVLEKAYVDLRSGKSRSGKQLSGTYVNDIAKKVSLMMAHALKNGIIAENPCDKADKPKIDTGEKRALDNEQVNKLASMLNPTEHMQCALLLCMMLGLRRGEVVGLSWEDVNFDEDTVHVCHSYDDKGNMNTPKTKAGDRFIPMSDVVRKALKKREESLLALFTLYAPELLKVDNDGNVVGIADGTPVICDQYGVRIHPAGLGHWWYKKRGDYGLDGWTLHEMRHTFLSVAAKQGVHPSVMQKLAGHSTARITMEVYTHANMDAQRDAMNAMQQVFVKKSA